MKTKLPPRQLNEIYYQKLTPTLMIGARFPAKKLIVERKKTYIEKPEA